MRSAINRDALRDVKVAELQATNLSLVQENQRLKAKNGALMGKMRAILTLAGEEAQ
jgi:hypothetical protein